MHMQKENFLGRCNKNNFLDFEMVLKIDKGILKNLLLKAAKQFYKHALKSCL
jgi:hypothetical protein